MSGHSKWSTIKRKKGKEDAKKGQIFSKLSQKIIMAAREGGGDPSTNSALANAIENAKSQSMPMENIKRAIARGTGELGGGELERMNFEGYGEGGVALMVEVLTDNKNRAASQVRYVFSKRGGRLGEAGSVSWIFEKKGVFLVRRDDSLDEDKLLTIALEGGADDLDSEGEDYWEITCAVEHFNDVKKALAAAGIEPESAELTMFPKTTVTLDRDSARKVLKLIEELEDLDDVSDVYSNFDVPEEVLEEITSAS